MQILHKVDQLIQKLTDLKPILSEDSPNNSEKFDEILKASLTNSSSISNASNNAINSYNNNTLENNWASSDYSFNPLAPRKPNMRELMEAMSGKTLEDLYKEPIYSWQKISRQASDILYGVVGSNEDTRDWLSIMSSNDIVTKAREQTGAMYEPEVDIQSNFNDKGILTEQIAVIKDYKGNILRSLSSNITSSEEKLLNFGVTKDSIPTNLEEKIVPGKFDNDLLAFLINFDNTSTQSIVVQSASEAIANKISQEIPIDELAKL